MGKKFEGTFGIFSVLVFQITVPESYLEYNIIFPPLKKTERKPCCIREQIIGIVMASERDLDNVTCVWSLNLYVL